MQRATTFAQYRDLYVIYAGWPEQWKTKTTWPKQMTFDTCIHKIKLENGIKYQSVVMQGYICNMCREVNKSQYKTTWICHIKSDMWSSRVWFRLMKNAVKFDDAGQLVKYKESIMC